MKNYPQIISKVYGEPWVITKEKHSAIRAILESRLGESVGTGSYNSWTGQGVAGASDDVDYPEPKQFGKNYVIPVYGVLGKHLSGMEIECGGCSVDAINKMIQVALIDPIIEHVIFDFDSPGGTVTGIPETAKLIAQLSEEKDTTAYCESICCSGGYWLASQANRFVCTESAVIGSIGVYSVYIDETEAMKKNGIKANPISAGKFKLSGASFKEMTDEERAMFQARVDGVYSKFKAACTEKRMVPEESMQGQIFYGEEAVAKGLCDELVEDIEELFQ